MRKGGESWDCSVWKREIMGGVYPYVLDGGEKRRHWYWLPRQAVESQSLEIPKP